MFDRDSAGIKKPPSLPGWLKDKKDGPEYGVAIGKYNLHPLAMQTDLPNNKCIW